MQPVLQAAASMHCGTDVRAVQVHLLQYGLVGKVRRV
jgi:hypothetical protein